MTADFPAPEPDEDEGEGLPWEKAFAQNGFSPDLLDDLPELHLTMLHDHLTGLADERFGANGWIERGTPLVEDFEPLTREREYGYDDEDGNPVLDSDGNPVMIAYHDDNRYFRMTSWFRPKGEGE